MQTWELLVSFRLDRLKLEEEAKQLQEIEQKYGETEDENEKEEPDKDEASRNQTVCS